MHVLESTSNRTTDTHPNQPPDFNGHTLEASVNVADNHSFVTFKIQLGNTDTTHIVTQTAPSLKAPAALEILNLL